MFTSMPKCFVDCVKLVSGTLNVLGFLSDGVVVVRVLEFTEVMEGCFRSGSQTG